MGRLCLQLVVCFTVVCPPDPTFDEKTYSDYLNSSKYKRVDDMYEKSNKLVIYIYIYNCLVNCCNVLFALALSYMRYFC